MEREPDLRGEAIRDNGLVHKRAPGLETDSEYIVDSPTDIRLSIECICYREKLDQAFNAAILRIKQKQSSSRLL